MNGKLPKVVSVIDAFKVVINRGARDGVKVGQRFLIYGLGEEVRDPFTNELLGQIELVRGRGEVVHVQEKMSTLRCVEKTKLPEKVRRIKQPFSVLYGEVVEEFGKGEFEDEPFDGAEVSDQARPI